VRRAQEESKTARRLLCRSGMSRWNVARKSRLRAISQEFNQDVGEVEQVFEIVENQQEFVRLKEFTELRFGTICA
ncbi:MAG: hypothetical protein WBE17_04550, partial [Anaerolineae bacterium]